MRKKTLRSISPSLQKNFPAAAGWLALGIFGFGSLVFADDPPAEPESPPVIEIEGDGAPVNDDRDDVTVTVTADGTILAVDEPAIRGEGQNWTVDNSGLLRQTGEARATVHLNDGTFFNRIPAAGEGDDAEPVAGRILWESGADYSLGDGETTRFSSVYLESWSRDATNWGEIRLDATHDMSLTGTGSTLEFSAVHLGARADAEEGEDRDPLTFTNRGEIGSQFSGGLDGVGSDNVLRVTGVRIDGPEWIDNHGRIEAVFEGNIGSAAANRVEVSGIRTEEAGDLWNYGDGVVSARISATGTATGAELAVTGVVSEGFLTLGNEGRIEAILEEGLGGDPSESQATGVLGNQGGSIENRGEIEVRNELAGGRATGIRLGQIEEEEAPEADENGDSGTPAPPRSDVSNSGTLVVRAGEDGIATGVWSDGNLTLTNPGSIVVGGLLLEGAGNSDDGEPVETAPFESGVGVRVENGDGDFTNGGLIEVTGDAGTLHGIVFEDGGIVRNQGEIRVINDRDGGAATGITIRRDTTLDEEDPGRRAEVDNTGRIEVGEGDLAVNLENGGRLRNAGIIIGDVYLGDSDATLVITPGHELDGTVDVGGGRNVLELGHDGTGPGEYGGEYVGFDELLVDAENTHWRLTGDQQYEGAEVLTGVLRLEGGLTLTVDPMVVRENGVLLGSARADGLPRLTGDLDVFGVVAIGDLADDRFLIAPEETGPMLIDGSATFREGSELNVIAGATWLETTGAVVIDDATDSAGSTVVVNLTESNWGDNFQIVEAQGGLTGRFLNEETAGFRPFLLPVLEYGPTGVSANVIADGEALAGAAQTHNQREMARVLANLDPSAGLLPGFQQFFHAADQETYGGLVDTMSGEIIASGAAGAISLGRGVRQTIFNTIHHRPETLPRYQTRPPGSEPEPRPVTPARGFWTRVLAVRGDLDRQGGGSVDYRTHGILLGYDFVSTKESRTGIAVGYGDARVSRGADRVDSDAFQVALYGSRTGGVLVYDGILGYGYHDMNSRRVVQPAGEALTAGFGAHEFNAALQATLPLELEGVAVLPVAGLDFTHFRQDGFRESGDWAIDGSSFEMNTLSALVGLRVMGQHRTTRNGFVAPEVRLGYTHTLLDREGTFSGRLVQDNAQTRFATRGAEVGSGQFSIGTGVMIAPGRWDNVSIFADYDFQVSNQHVASTGFRIAF